MRIWFRKMHGLGNDFIIVDQRVRNFHLSTQSITRLCHRHYGIGCDQLVVLEPSEDDRAAVFVRFFNPDGSEAEACGNASRCVAALLGGSPTLQTRAGFLKSCVTETGEIGIDMGVPLFGWSEIPLAEPVDSLALPLPQAPAACSIGNPHVTFFDGAENAEKLGPSLERHPLFPQRVNVGFAQILAPNKMRLRVWERGAGLTLACGSGACAAVVNGVRQARLSRDCYVSMDGGDLHIIWRDDGRVEMYGPTTHVFDGVYTL